MSDDGRNGEAGGGKAHPRSSGAPPRFITDSLAKPLARRFYKDASVADAAPFQILLDGRPVKTPKKRPLHLPSRPLAEAIAAEWRAQEALIDPARMPLTRFTNTAIDAVADALDAVAADIVAYAGSDLVCYRAEAPEQLVALQSRDWDPIIAWAEDALGARFKVVPGVIHVAQSAAALEAVAAALTPHEAFRLTGLHALATLTGSALLTLDLASGHLSADAAWTAAHVDEDYQISLWGEDSEAAARRRHRRAEFDAANLFLALLAS
jgi:chaperone required for assembly of F1-ATPase